jgi:hypothetical protein
MKLTYRQLIVGFVLSVVFLSLSASASPTDEISLFDHKGRPVAYIAEDRTIYLWEGKPVAYIFGENNEVLDVYGFNGKHIGWFKGGIIYDEDGDAVGGVKEVFKTPTQFEPFKGFKEFKPLKSLREIRPIKPMFSKQWSEVPLKYFLRQGIDSD